MGRKGAPADWQAYLDVHHAEIGATAKHPADHTMRRGIMMGYVTIIGAYLTVSITGVATSNTRL